VRARGCGRRSARALPRLLVVSGPARRTAAATMLRSVLGQPAVRAPPLTQAELDAQATALAMSAAASSCEIGAGAYDAERAGMGPAGPPVNVHVVVRYPYDTEALSHTPQTCRSEPVHQVLIQVQGSVNPSVVLLDGLAELVHMVGTQFGPRATVVFYTADSRRFWSQFQTTDGQPHKEKYSCYSVLEPYVMTLRGYGVKVKINSQATWEQVKLIAARKSEGVKAA